MRYFFFVWALTFLAVSPITVLAEDSNIGAGVKEEISTGMTTKFWLYYEVVSNVFKNDKRYVVFANEIDEVNPNITQAISDVWWQKIVRDCDLESTVNNIVKRSSKTDFEQISDKVSAEMRNCGYLIIFENWSDINKIIFNARSAYVGELSWWERVKLRTSENK